MMARSAHRRAGVWMPRDRAARPIFRPQRHPRHVTTVTRFPAVGILPKHANGRLVPDNLVWETSMPLGNSIFRGRSPFEHVPHARVPRADVPRADVPRAD